MENRAPYHTLTPQGPRNLASHVAAWLRTQGFTVSEQERPATATVAAVWRGPQQEAFELTYAWQSGPVPSATCWLTVRYPGQPLAETLFTAQQVRRVKDLRQLLTGCVRYANARLLVKPASVTT